MATNNACNMKNAGVQTLLSTGAMSGSTGALGTLLVSTGATTAPSFAASANGDFTFTTSTAGAARELAVTNTDNTNGLSIARLTIVTQPSGGDAYAQFIINATRTYALGIDNSDSDNFKLTTSTSTTSPSGASILFNMSSGGARTLPLNPTVFAYVHNGGANLTNVTGDGTLYTVIYDATSIDSGTNFNTGTGTFTAPVTGRYRVTVNNTLTNLGAGHTSAQLTINANGVVSRTRFNPVAGAVSGSYTASLTGTYIVAAGGTITSQVTVSGSTKTVGLEYDNFAYYSSMEINLIG